MRWTACVVLVGLISASACKGPPIKEAQDPDGGSPGRGGGSGAGGTGGGGTSGAGTAGAGTAGAGGSAAGGGNGGSAASGGRGGTGGTGGANACARCETPCQDGICNAAIVRSSQTSVYSTATSTALSDGRLYFVVNSGVSASVQVLSVAAGGGPETELYPRHDCSGCQLTLAVDGADVFFAGLNTAGTSSILAVAKDGSSGGVARIVCMTPSALPGALTLDGDYVYYVRADTGIERCPKAGGMTEHVATAGSAQSPNVVIRMGSRPGAIVWGDRDSGVVRRLVTSGPTLQPLGVTANTEPTGPTGVCDAVDDGTQAFWILCAWPYTLYAENGVNMPMERGAGLGGGDANAIFDQYGSVGLDGNYVYFTEAGYLNRVLKTGGSVEPRGRMFDGNNQYPVKALIVGFDDRYVYLALANMGDGAIYRVVK